MKNTIFLVIFLTGMYMFQSCDSQKNVLKDVPEDKLENTFNLKTGDVFEIKLKSNPSAGYKWSIENKIKPKIIKEISKEYLKDENTSDMIGAGGVEIYKFEAIKKGVLFLHFVYERENGKRDKEKYFKIEIK